jgi:hypothetical protein
MTDSRCAALQLVAERAAEARERLLNSTFGPVKASRLQGLRTLEAQLDESFRSCMYYRIQPALREAWDASVAGLSSEEKAHWAACVLADLIARAPERLPDFPTPDSILPHMADEFSRVLNELENEPAAPRDLGNDLFMKDLSLCRLDGFPCVAQVVDKNSGIPRRLVAARLLQQPAALLAMGLRSGFRYAPTFEIHTHTPMLKGFTPDGWDQCYLLTADLLELYPQYQGLTGGSWFYDPELDRVSPRLSYLRDRPLSGGAFLLRMGQRPIDIVNATSTSETSRKLYEAGEYHPTAWMIVWPRQALLDWARANRQGISQSQSIQKTQSIPKR